MLLMDSNNKKIAQIKVLRVGGKKQSEILPVVIKKANDALSENDRQASCL